MSNYVIIGAAGGIGSDLVNRLDEDNHNLFLSHHSGSNSKLLDFQTHAVDSTSFESMEKFIEKGKKNLGKIDGIISLPGTILLRPPHLFSEDDYKKVVDTNLKSAFSVVRAVGKFLDNTVVVMMSTAVTNIGLANHEAVVASKSGIESIARSASVTYARKKIRFNVVAPGLVDTPLSSPIIKNPVSLEYSKKLHITEEIGRPKDITNMIKFLIDPENKWITGQTFAIDGGLSSTKK